MDGIVRKAPSADPIANHCGAQPRRRTRGRRSLASGGSDPALASLHRIMGHDAALASPTLLAAAGVTLPSAAMLAPAADMLRFTGATMPSASDMLRIAEVNATVAGAISPPASLQSMLTAAAEARRIHDELFRIPHHDELATLTEAASAGALARLAFGDDFSSLRAAMDAVRASWLRDGALAESALVSAHSTQ
jgi:hypothetical protein